MAVDINERATVKRLVVCGNDEVWSEMSAGIMIELNTSSGAIDTSDNLNIFEAFQKVFVVNGENLKVADFVNTKLTLAEFSTAPTRGSTVIQENGTTAEMIVDFVSADKKVIYGYVTAGVFDTTTAISGGGIVSANSLIPTSIAGMLTHILLATPHATTDTLTQADTDVAWADTTDYVVGDVVLDTEEYICIVAHTSDVGGGDGTGGAPNGGGNTTEWTATVTATMVVEYTDAAKTHTWGRITAGIFDTDNLVSGDDAGTAFTPTATDISPPVWYDWTVYPTIGETTYGTMPTKAYLGCLYRGRNVLAGNPIYPHQWYMSKIGDPWNWVYASTDPLTAAAGNSADAGETGDIIRALIPYKDDYLIFGCASTIWVLTGDPAGGGKIDEVDLTVGMYGANSWCFDGDGNLYFWGTAGIYKIPLGFRSVENLTEISLPDLVAEQVGSVNVTPATHRITMGYDRKRHGLLICITKLSDGDNSNYFYDLKLQGFFPESYPDECGAYSLFYYAANDNDYADLLVGCKDGYIRKFDDTAKDDDIGVSNDAISSYVVYPIQHLTEDNDKEGRLSSLVFELSGGASGGTFSDTDNVSYELYVADDAETCIENIKDGHTAFASGTLSGTGRKNRIRTRVRGAYLGLKLLNSTEAETWGINKIFGTVKEVGQIK